MDMVPDTSEMTVRWPNPDAALKGINRIVNSHTKYTKHKMPLLHEIDPCTYRIVLRARLQKHKVLPKVVVDHGVVINEVTTLVPAKVRRQKGYHKTHPVRYDAADFLACVEAVLDHPKLFKDHKASFHGDIIEMSSLRYKNFLYNGCTCVKCGLVGTFFLKQMSHESDEHYHMNLYALDKDGGLVLMTRDHIIPKSKGGPNTLENLQPMCGPCNWKKGAKLPSDHIDQIDLNGAKKAA